MHLLSPARIQLLATWLLAVTLALHAPLRAEDEPLPPKPQALVYDDARLFNAEQAAQVEALLRECEAKTGVRVQVAAFTLLQRPDLLQQSRALVTPWLGDHAAVLLCFHRGSGRFTVSYSNEMWRVYPSSDLISAHDKVTALTNDRSQPDPALRMISGVKEMVQSVVRMEAERRARLRLFSRRDMALATALSLLLLGLGAGAWVGFRKLQAHDLDRSTRIEFPDVGVATRLGAPLGGGVIGEASIHR